MKRFYHTLPVFAAAMGLAASLAAPSLMNTPAGGPSPAANGFTGLYFGLGAGFFTGRVETDLTLDIEGGERKNGIFDLPGLGTNPFNGTIPATKIEAKSKATPSGFTGGAMLGGGYVIGENVFLGGEVFYFGGEASKNRRAYRKSSSKSDKDSSSSSSSSSTDGTLTITSGDAKINGEDLAGDINQCAEDAGKTDLGLFGIAGLNKYLDKASRPGYVREYAAAFTYPLLAGNVKVRSQFGGALLLGMVQRCVRFGIKAGVQSTNVQMTLPTQARSADWVKVSKNATGFLTGLFADYKFGSVAGKGPIIGLFADFVLGSPKLGDEFQSKAQSFYKKSDKMETAVFRAACREGDAFYNNGALTGHRDIADHMQTDNYAINLDMRREEAKVTGTIKLKTPMRFGLRVLIPF